MKVSPRSGFLLHQTWADVASRGRLEIGSGCCNRGQMIFVSYMLQHLAVPFWELVWPSQQQHFQEGRDLTKWLVRKVASYDGAILKVTHLFSKAVLLPGFVCGDCMTVCSNFIQQSATGVAEIVESTHLTWCPHTLYSIYKSILKFNWFWETDRQDCMLLTLMPAS
jgi:hypothetical protein